jgi:SNF2 family DNA or RNA helicase
MMEFKPHNYQVVCIERLISDPHIAMFLEMGLGKTIITLSAIQILKYDMWQVRKALVIAPKRVAESTWPNEVKKWRHLRDLSVSVICGTAEQRRKAVSEPADVYVIGRDNLQWLVDLERRRWDFDMVVVDELSGFKDSSTRRFKALRSVLDRVDRIVGLTGTPAPNGLIDLWAEMYLLDRGERLGYTLTGFRDRYFNHNPYRHEYTPKAGAAETIQKLIADICVSMRSADYLTLPECITVDIPVVLDGETVERYKRLERDMVLEYAGVEITAVNAMALSNKLLQLCSGGIYAEDAPLAPLPTCSYLVEGRHVLDVHSAKIEALRDTIEALNGEHAIVFYEFRHEVPRIKDAIPKRFRVRELKTPEDERAWNAGEVDFLLTHPASSAYGLNLQAGGHHMIWFGLPWSLQLYQQAVARLHRQGQEHPVIVHRLLVEGGLDENVANVLDGKRDVQEGLLEALRACVHAVAQEILAA